MASNYNFEYCFSLLKENDEYVEKEAKTILTKICDNIINKPNEAKYRKVRIGNAVVEKKLMPAIGAIECLFAAGFIENDDGFLLPLNSSLSGVQELKKMLNASPVTPKTQPPTKSTEIQTRICTKTPTKKLQLNEPQPSTSESYPVEKYVRRRSFLEKIISGFKDVLRYEDPNLQAKVKSIVPITNLQLSAINKLRKFQKELKASNSTSASNQSRTLENEYTVQDLVLLELVHWFKAEFFEWVNTPKCDFCSSDSKFEREKPSSHPHISRVEVYKCNVCNKLIEFPRYFDPEPLLVTRKGRCGEWANCFTLICRTFGYDARFVIDETDHVWTEVSELQKNPLHDSWPEVWSISDNRWIHVDPCEDAVDTPLMYEKGWGKKLSYIVAFSKDEVQDVTWRYTRDNEAVLKRRNHCSETTLRLLIWKLNNQRMESLGYSETRKNYIINRRLRELVDMLPAPPGAEKSSKENDNKEYQGRISGSLAWRLARGEITAASTESHKWVIPESCKTFTLKYFILDDKYEVLEELDTETKKRITNGWQTGVDEVEGGIFRKVENDWKMVYLARSSEAPDGKIKWTFKVEDKQTLIHSIELQALSATFEQGKITWDVEGSFENTDCKKVQIPDCYCFKTEALDGASEVRIIATLGGGTNWQHAQLFRRSLNPDNKHSMVIKIILRK